MNTSTKEANNREYSKDVEVEKRLFWNRILRYFVFNLILLIVGFSQNLFSHKITTIVAGFLFTVFNINGLIILKRQFKLIFKSISYNGELFSLKYLEYAKNKEFQFEQISAHAIINFTHYSTKTTLPLKVTLETEKGKIIFYLLLKETILLFHFLEENGGIIKKDFDFKMALKELRTNEEYKDVLGEINDLLSYG